MLYNVAKKGGAPMRLQLKFKLEEEFFPMDYHKLIVHFLKIALTSHQDGKFFDHFYCAQQSESKKDYSWSIRLSKPVFSKNHIKVTGKEFVLLFVTPDMNTMLIFMNAFMGQKFKTLKISESNSMQLYDIRPIQQKTVQGNVLEAKLFSPLALREHSRETNLDKYYTPSDDAFIPALKESLFRQFPNFSKEIEEMRMDVSRLKKVVVLLYGQYIDVSIGSILFLGNEELLNAMLSHSIGSRKPMGFGVLEKVDSWEVNL